jgi:hypothetical protein
MSLDMTIGGRGAGSLETVAQACDETLLEVPAAPVERIWLQDLLTVAATAFGVVFSSALGVLLYLR